MLLYLAVMALLWCSLFLLALAAFAPPSEEPRPSLKKERPTGRG